MKPQVVIFVAPPGAGKGTQAAMLADKFGWVHLESSKVIEEKFAKASSDDLIINIEKENWLTGKLVSPELVTKWMIEKIKMYHAKGESLIFSASPRSMYEAENQMPLHEELYGKENIQIFHITIGEEESIKRNSNRRMCKGSKTGNRHPIPDQPKYKDITVCPWDGSEIMTRKLDKPDVIKERIIEYRHRTEPILGYITSRGYKIINIDGEQDIERVSQDVLKYFVDVQ